MAQRDVLDTMVALRDRRTPYVVATVVECEGSVSARPGAKAVIGGDGERLTGWVGGGCADAATREAALQTLASGEPMVIDIDLQDEVLGAGMPCGGHMRVYVEPVQPRPRLWVVGHGGVAEALSRLGATVGLDVVVDDAAAEPSAYPDATRVITDDLNYSALEPGPDDFVVVATQHKGDHRSIQRCLDCGTGYVALVASRRRAGIVRDTLRELGMDEERLARLRAPAGFDLGGSAPEEIALSIVGEIVMLRRGGTGKLKSAEAPAKQHTPASG